MKWIKVMPESMFPGYYCSNCHHVMVIFDECLGMPEKCPKCKEEEE